ncbi:UNVERIFIED_CONTAM: hypothetical protein Slati_2154100 [Sesamum latifolium]|uniref:RNase H type-1 domain-containing protein n=1 Tax=Sesamum latifolium TaxID=2727402 RepID=A0AAW2WTM4_9LAMI
MRNFQFTAEPALAETLAARTAIQLGIQEGWRNIVLEGDCQNVIRRLSSNIEDNSVIGSVIDDIRYLIKDFTCSTVEYIPRELNNLAHKLARFALRDVDDKEHFPNFLL